MMAWRAQLASLAALALISCGLDGCGGDDKGNSASTTTTTTQSFIAFHGISSSVSFRRGQVDITWPEASAVFSSLVMWNLCSVCRTPMLLRTVHWVFHCHMWVFEKLEPQRGLAYSPPPSSVCWSGYHCRSNRVAGDPSITFGYIVPILQSSFLKPTLNHYWFLSHEGRERVEVAAAMKMRPLIPAPTQPMMSSIGLSMHLAAMCLRVRCSIFLLTRPPGEHRDLPDLSQACNLSIILKAQ